ALPPLSDRAERGSAASESGGRAAARQLDGRYDATVITYENAHVEEWRIAPLGHAWSGGSPEATYTDPQGPDATAAIVDFFERHLSSLPTLTSSPTTSST
ncbi:MAG TPA: hypothetical protein VEU30_03425, partial [Thermoanaerobaculia bacterium]|nr:hypothetical protein [Thermoanaerobaculia bacterium]